MVFQDGSETCYDVWCGDGDTKKKAGQRDGGVKKRLGGTRMDRIKNVYISLELKLLFNCCNGLDLCRGQIVDMLNSDRQKVKTTEKIHGCCEGGHAEGGRDRGRC